MSDYSQPDFYRFNEDSLRLVDYVCEKKTAAVDVLDLGAGSGIIGIEVANRLRARSLTLLEMQTDYASHLELNLTQFLNPEIQHLTVFSTFGDWKPTLTYDLIVCNPPYYFPGHGEVSKDQRRHLARTFAVDDLAILINLICSSLSKDGEGYLVLKHEKKMMDEVCRLGGEVEVSKKMLFVRITSTGCR